MKKILVDNIHYYPLLIATMYNNIEMIQLLINYSLEKNIDL